jgi:hypothetical protein
MVISPQVSGAGRAGGPLFRGGAPVAFLVYVDPRAVQLDAASSDIDSLSVDPRAVQLDAESSDVDSLSVDPRAVQLDAASSDIDSLSVDPRAVQLVT